MANRFYNQFRLSLEKQVVDVYATVNVGTSGVPTLQAWTGSPFAGNGYVSASAGFKGVKSVARNSSGSYTFTFQDNFQRLLGAGATIVTPSGSVPAAPLCYVSGTTANSASVTNIQATANGGGQATVTLVFTNTGSVAADPGAGERLLCTFVFGNSSAY